MFVSVLGVDPGLTRCGYGVVTMNEKNTFEFSRSGVLSTSPQEQVSLRLAEMHNDLTELIEEINPTFIAVERILFQSNVSTAMSVAQVSGLVHSIAASKSIVVTEYSPNEVKNAITGDGRADKQALAKMVTNLLKLSKLPQPADAADALAIALTHAFSLKTSATQSDTSDNATYNGSKLHNAISDAILRQVKKEPDPKKLERDSQHRTRVRRRSGLAR